MVGIDTHPCLSLCHLSLDHHILVVVLAHSPTITVGVGQAPHMIVIVVKLLLHLLDLLLLHQLLLLPAVVINGWIIFVVFHLLSLIQNSVAAWIHLQLLLVFFLVLCLLLLPSKWISWICWVIACILLTLVSSISHRHWKLLLLLLSHHLFKLYLISSKHDDSTASSSLMMRLIDLPLIWSRTTCCSTSDASSLTLFCSRYSISCLLSVVLCQILLLWWDIDIQWWIDHAHHLVDADVHRLIFLVIWHALRTMMTSWLCILLLIIWRCHEISSSSHRLSHCCRPLMVLLLLLTLLVVDLLILLLKDRLIKLITMKRCFHSVSWNLSVDVQWIWLLCTPLWKHLRPSIRILRRLCLRWIVATLSTWIASTWIIRILIVLHFLDFK